MLFSFFFPRLYQHSQAPGPDFSHLANVDSDRTPEAVEDVSLEAVASSLFKKAMNYIKSM